MESPKKNRTEWMFAGLLGLVALEIVMMRSGGVRGSMQLVAWLGAGVHRKIYPEQNAAGPIYADTARGPLSLATLVAQFRVAWPGESVAVVHGAAGEVAADLLHHGDIEVGELDDGKFVAWPMRPWEAEEKILTELRSQPGFLTNESRYVFRRKPATK